MSCAFVRVAGCLPSDAELTESVHGQKLISERNKKRERERVLAEAQDGSRSLSLVWVFLTDGVSLDGSPSENHGSIFIQSNPDHLLSSSLPPSIPLLALYPSIQCQFDCPVCLMPRPFIYPLCPAAPLLSAVFYCPGLLLHSQPSSLLLPRPANTPIFCFSSIVTTVLLPQTDQLHLGIPAAQTVDSL